MVHTPPYTRNQKGLCIFMSPRWASGASHAGARYAHAGQWDVFFQRTQISTGDAWKTAWAKECKKNGFICHFPAVCAELILTHSMGTMPCLHAGCPDCVGSTPASTSSFCTWHVFCIPAQMSFRGFSDSLPRPRQQGTIVINNCLWQRGTFQQQRSVLNSAVGSRDVF